MSRKFIIAMVVLSFCIPLVACDTDRKSYNRQHSYDIDDDDELDIDIDRKKRKEYAKQPVRKTAARSTNRSSRRSRRK